MVGPSRDAICTEAGSITNRNDIEAPRYTPGPREDVPTADQRFLDLPRGAPSTAGSRPESGSVWLQNAEFSGVELEYELTRIDGRSEKGGIERRLVFGMALRLARAGP